MLGGKNFLKTFGSLRMNGGYKYDVFIFNSFFPEYFVRRLKFQVNILWTTQTLSLG